MAMVMPRSFSSGALSIWSKGVKSAIPFSDRTLVMAAVRVVLPWSMCPIVPMFTWGLFRSNFFLDMVVLFRRLVNAEKYIRRYAPDDRDTTLGSRLPEANASFAALRRSLPLVVL